jgi:hypothetical protein
LHLNPGLRLYFYKTHLKTWVYLGSHIEDIRGYAIPGWYGSSRLFCLSFSLTLAHGHCHQDCYHIHNPGRRGILAQLYASPHLVLIKSFCANDVCSDVVALAPSVRHWAHRNVSLLLCHKVH